MRMAVFAGLAGGLSWVFFAPISELLRMAISDELYSYIPLIPLVSGVLVIRDCKNIFSETEASPGWGLGIAALGGLLFIITNETAARFARDDYLSGVTVSFVLCLYGGFLGSFGHSAFRSALFPLLFLLFMAPIPSPILDRVVLFLQVGSTEMVQGLFWLSGVPFLREGFTFHLPGLHVEVAKQCSGIRSSVSLVIVSLLMSGFVLKTVEMRCLLVLSTIPITLFKNGVRIATLSLLGTYVDRRVLESQLHQSGGIPIFALALALLFGTAWMLRILEKRRVSALTPAGTGSNGER